MQDHRLPRRALGALAASLMAAPRPSASQQSDWPRRPIRLICGFPPGGLTDIIARFTAQGLGAAWGQTVVVDNRSGAGGTIATDAVARAAPDGYTLFFATLSLVSNPPMFVSLPYDVERSFTALGGIAISPNVLACNAAMPWRTLGDFVTAAKAAPGTIAYSTSGIGSNGHYGGALLNMTAGIELSHVPYRGAAPATQDAISGTVPLTFNTLGTVLGAIRAGQLRALAVAGPGRNVDLPEIPTFTEAGYDLPDTSVWYGLVGPAGLPAALARRIESDVVALQRQPEMRERLQSQGSETLALDAAGLAARIREELPRWRRVAQAVGIRPE
ncbi:Bug family tripartite tricarboxylate transporter substrate binding protein [Plastoroseomonas arctica]|uniref:Tripartite tricarboxylate transporter substrate binding protein n=1 Tax=Plastoroseomonas arctica TaxID=1509237 RepID=A0AAF1JXG7_9PROT|nr:tripartite tricarboxylate transporter substrate binding protein [Plastoroseomonas arctica]MBR0656134.1 tripartite tricarboxylate transporter substrate binding protein [Plastoroseomonas arctica]